MYFLFLSLASSPQETIKTNNQNTSQFTVEEHNKHKKQSNLAVVIIAICLFHLKATNLPQFNRSAQTNAEKMAVKSNASGENMET
jgi:hypothetical protein